MTRPGRVTATAALLCVALAACGHGTATSPTALVDIGAGLRGPSGVTATVYATGLPHAAAFAFDSRGRLWAATADYSDSGADAVYVVDHAGATPTPVITGLHTPLGLLWIGDRLLVASKELVEAYSGLDGTAFATHSALLSLPAGVGEVNGLVLAPGGRVQLGISAPCDHCTPTIEYSAAIVSFAPDGTDVQVDAGGIRAPIALAYVPGTDDLLVTMNQRDDLAGTTPGDWLTLVRDGDDFRFPDCYGQGGAACTGVPAPVAVLDAHAAVSGLAVVTGQLGPRVGTAAVVAEWATGAVLMVPLTHTGSTYAGTATPMVTGTKNPVAVALGPDGAVYLSDWTTGTVYRLSQ